MLCLSPTFPRLCKFTFLINIFINFVILFLGFFPSQQNLFCSVEPKTVYKHSNEVSPILHQDKRLITCPPSPDLIPLIILYMLNMVFGVLQYITLYSHAELMVCSKP